MDATACKGQPCTEPALFGQTLCQRHLELARRVERLNLDRCPDCDDLGRVCVSCNVPLGLAPCAHTEGQPCRSERHAVC